MNAIPMAVLAAAPATTPAVAAPSTPAPVAAPAPAAPVTQATEVQPAPDGQSPQGQPQSAFGGMFIPLLLMLALFYFMMIRPQQRKEKERRKMIEELRAGTRILFANGLIGTIAEAREKTFLVEVAPDVKIEIARDCVQGVARSGAEADKK